MVQRFSSFSHRSNTLLKLVEVSFYNACDLPDTNVVAIAQDRRRKNIHCQ